MQYWPSYRDISARARAGYLEWLAGGRRTPGAYIGFVFLFFYGIERRLLVDAQESPRALGEADVLLDEVEQLLAVYGENHSFRGYASSFLEMGRFLHRSVSLSEIEPPVSSGGWEVPLTTKLALGAFAQQGEPVPVEWALSWVLSSQQFRRRTAAQRCAEEFRHLFTLRYQEHFRGGGLKIKPNKTRLTAEYRAASPSFGHSPLRLTLPDLPDVTGLSAPVRKLQELVDGVTDALDPYSRWVGRNDDRTSLQALSLLPPELGRQRESVAGEAFSQAVSQLLAGSAWAVVESEVLAKIWTSGGTQKLTKKDSEMLARVLDQQGMGLEPDVRWGGPPLGRTERAVLFRRGHDQAPATEFSNGYRAAASLMGLAAAVSAADGEVGAEEREHLEQHLEEGLELDGEEKLRLRHHFKWLVEEPPSLASIKRGLAAVSAEDGRPLGRFLIAVAGADGRVDPEEIKILRRIYPLLGLDAGDVISDLHALRAGGRAEEDEPVTVVVGRPSDGFTIPSLGEEDATRDRTIGLDIDKILATRKATERVAALLAGIFEEGEEPPATVPVPAAPGALSLCGLDAAHSAFLLRLAESESWERSDLERLAQELGVLPEGALEIINDAAFEAYGDPLFEGDETIVIDREILGEMTA